MHVESPRQFERLAVVSDAGTAEQAPAKVSGERSAAPITVMKFGGTSVATPELIRSVARRVVTAHDAGDRVVVVASAMGKSTDQLIGLAREVSSTANEREMDMLLSVGERITCALIAMAITDLGRKAVSLTGSQAGIVTDDVHGKAKIVDIRAQRLTEALDKDQIVLVAGFQGVSRARNVTTLGRGGSDATAVALAAALGARVCEIYTDVDGVYTADPRVVPSARKLASVSYGEMLEMAGSGAQVLMLRSVEFARNYGVALHVRSSFSDEPGTWIRKAGPDMEKALITGITHDRTPALVTVTGIPENADAVPALFEALAAHSVNVDLLLRTAAVGASGTGSISFTVPEEDLASAEAALTGLGDALGNATWETDADVGSISLVGAGMKTHSGVASRVFSTLAAEGIASRAVTTSPIRISCLVPAARLDDAARALHAAFEVEILPEEHAHELEA